jgi:SAM-dependent methyltransferase
LKSRVSGLYDALHAFEARYRGSAPYPVHKRLSFPDGRDRDVYDWIAEHVTLPPGARVLDAGCGTGFGTFRLAEAMSAKVSGISLSAAEIASARRAARDRGRAEQVDFEVADYDALPAAAFDCVVAVESVKHSHDLPGTLASLTRSLRRGGMLMVVEDCGSGDTADPLADRLKRAWHLSELYSERDYLAAAPELEWQVSDLTAAVFQRSRAAAIVSRAAVRATALVSRPFSASVAGAFEGAAALEDLYAAGRMHYKALMGRRRSTAVES